MEGARNFDELYPDQTGLGVDQFRIFNEGLFFDFDNNDDTVRASRGHNGPHDLQVPAEQLQFAQQTHQGYAHPIQQQHTAQCAFDYDHNPLRTATWPARDLLQYNGFQLPYEQALDGLVEHERDVPEDTNTYPAYGTQLGYGHFLKPIHEGQVAFHRAADINNVNTVPHLAAYQDTAAYPDTFTNPYGAFDAGNGGADAGMDLDRFSNEQELPGNPQEMRESNHDAAWLPAYGARREPRNSRRTRTVHHRALLDRAAPGIAGNSAQEQEHLQGIAHAAEAVALGAPVTAVIMLMCDECEKWYPGKSSLT
ncbi:hypothetical protein LTR95_014913 [Oleoguttula sp. CCFEE 5521]